MDDLTGIADVAKAVVSRRDLTIYRAAAIGAEFHDPGIGSFLNNLAKSLCRNPLACATGTAWDGFFSGSAVFSLGPVRAVGWHM
jgi:hypothetical protein